MRHLYLLPALAAALLAAPAAHAQQAWQPFRVGLTYQLTEAGTPGDTVHVLRLGAGAPVAGSATDSLFRFSGRVGRPGTAPSATPCRSTRQVRPDNLFGATLRTLPGAVAVLSAANGRSLTLRPRAAVGSTWATGVAGLTATLSSRSRVAVLGGAPDSVATITFSDGEVVQLARRTGWLSGPSLDSYLNGRNRRRHLTLSALPERGLGTAVTGALAVYDFQPGDVFQYTSRSSLNGTFGNTNLCEQRWWQDSVLTRQASRTGDTITYTVRTWSRSQGYGTAGAPGGFCSVPTGVTIMAPYTHTTVIVGSQQSPTGIQTLTSFFPVVANNIVASSTGLAARSSTRLAGRYEYSDVLQINCLATSLDSVVLTYPFDLGSLRRYGAGVGLTYGRYIGIYNDDITELTAFRKGSQSWGTFFPRGYLLPSRATQAAATTSAFPNPFGDGLTVRFALAGAQAVGVSLLDALGRPVRRADPVLLPAGSQQLALPTAGLAPGLYTLVLDFGADGHREVLRVARAE